MRLNAPESMWIDAEEVANTINTRNAVENAYRNMNRGGVRPLNLNVVPSRPNYLNIPKKPQYRTYVARTPGGQVNSERKYYDRELNTTIATVSTAFTGAELDPATTNALFAPTQGNDISNREGRKCLVHSVRINGMIIIPAQVNQTAGDEGCCIRLGLVMDKQTNGTQLNSEDVWTSGTAAAPILMSFQNTQFFGRFQVLKEKTFNIQPNNITYDGTNLEQQGSIRAFKLKYTWKTPLVVNFNATNGGTVADIVDNSFHVIGACNNITLAPSLQYKSRVSFSD